MKQKGQEKFRFCISSNYLQAAQCGINAFIKNGDTDDDALSISFPVGTPDNVHAK